MVPKSTYYTVWPAWLVTCTVFTLVTSHVFPIFMFYASWLICNPSQFQWLTHRDCQPQLSCRFSSWCRCLGLTGQSPSDRSALLASCYARHTRAFASGAGSSRWLVPGRRLGQGSGKGKRVKRCPAGSANEPAGKQRNLSISVRAAPTPMAWHDPG